MSYRRLPAYALLLLTLVLTTCAAPTSDSTWSTDERGLPGYSIATGLAIGPDQTVYAATFREGAVYTRRPGETWNHDPAMGNIAGYGVAAGPRAGLALAATVDGVYRTVDAGRRWSRVSERAPFTAVHFDPDGIAWAGGEAIVLRSDDSGATWHRAATFDPGVVILGLATGKAGLSIATAGGGAFLLREDGLHRTLVIRQVISSIAADPAGRVVARVEGRLWRSATGEIWEPAPSPAQRQVMAVGASREGILAATEGAGVFRTRDGGESWEQAGAPFGSTVYAAGGGERLWAATSSGVLTLSPSGWETSGEGYGRPMVRGLSADRELLAATNDGVYRREADGWRSVSRDLRDVLTLFVHSSGASLYAGTWDRGVLRSDDGGRTWEPGTENEYARATIPALAGSGETIVARVEYDRTLQTRDRGESWPLTDAGLAGRTVFSLATDGQSFWAGTDGGVFLLQDSFWQALPPMDETATALLAAPGGLFAGTVDGLRRLEKDGWVSAGLEGHHVVALLAGKDGRPEYAGTSDQGVFRWNGRTWDSIGPAGIRVNALARDPSDGALVVAAETGVFRRR